METKFKGERLVVRVIQIGRSVIVQWLDFPDCLRGMEMLGRVVEGGSSYSLSSARFGPQIGISTVFAPGEDRSKDDELSLTTQASVEAAVAFVRRLEQLVEIGNKHYVLLQKEPEPTELESILKTWIFGEKET